MIKILGIESSCDETAASVVLYDHHQFHVQSNLISSQIQLHQQYGGVVPELASRKHIEVISSIVEQALEESGETIDTIDAIGITYAPGLIGALLVGVNFAKSLAFSVKKPLIPIHHIEGHVSALYLEHPDLKPPFLCLVASGGHSTIVLVEDYTTFKTVARTRDDAAGEAFDKISRVLSLGYPGGPAISKHAEMGCEDAIAFPRVRIPNSLDFSFSGVKTAVINHMHKAQQRNEQINSHDVAASFQKAVCEVLSDRLIEAAETYQVDQVCLAGGVASNRELRSMIQQKAEAMNYSFYVPSPVYCTDNAAMIAARAIHLFLEDKEKYYKTMTNLNAYSTKGFGDFK